MHNFQYRGFVVKAEVRSYEEWSIDEKGNLVEWIRDFENSIEAPDITYCVYDQEDDFIEDFEDFESAKMYIDKEAKSNGK